MKYPVLVAGYGESHLSYKSFQVFRVPLHPGVSGMAHVQEHQDEALY